MVIGLESDETPAVRAARKRRETIEEVLAAVPGINTMSQAEQDATKKAVDHAPVPAARVT